MIRASDLLQQLSRASFISPCPILAGLMSALRADNIDARPTHTVVGLRTRDDCCMYIRCIRNAGTVDPPPPPSPTVINGHPSTLPSLGASTAPRGRDAGPHEETDRAPGPRGSTPAPPPGARMGSGRPVRLPPFGRMSHLPPPAGRPTPCGGRAGARAPPPALRPLSPAAVTAALPTYCPPLSLFRAPPFPVSPRPPPSAHPSSISRRPNPPPSIPSILTYCSATPPPVFTRSEGAQGVCDIFRCRFTHPSRTPHLALACALEFVCVLSLLSFLSAGFERHPLFNPHPTPNPRFKILACDWHPIRVARAADGRTVAARLLDWLRTIDARCRARGALPGVRAYVSRSLSSACRPAVSHGLR